jgi:predicted transcriptional regulator
MATMNIEERKLELIQWLSVIDDVSLLDRLAELKEQSTRDWWDEISDDEKESISKGLEDADAGKLKPHSDASAICERLSTYLVN